MAKETIDQFDPNDDAPVKKHEAREGTKHLLAFLNYGGTNKDYLHKAKIGAVLVSSYVKHYASQTNREMVKLAIEKQQLRALPGGE